MIDVTRLIVTGLLGLLLAACSSSGGISKPGSPGGSGTGLPGGGSGSPFPVPSSGKSGSPGSPGSDGGSAPSLPGGESGAGLPGAGLPGGGLPGDDMPGDDMPGMGEGGSGDSGDLEEVFEKSLGDFDGEMEQERAAMERAGRGSAGSADQREGADADTVGDATMKTGGGSGGMASIPSGGESGSDSPSDSPEDSSGSDAGGGQSEVEYDGKGEKGESSDRDGARVAKIPDDISADGSTDDQVARQIREAAMAETDPIIRDALWEEYRKHTGIKQ